MAVILSSDTELLERTAELDALGTAIGVAPPVWQQPGPAFE
jgi:hypothetical protein